jgi:hypothetical protein
MTEKEYNEFREILRRQRERVSSSKEEAEKLLTRLGIMHLLVPKGTNQKNANQIPPPSSSSH